MTKYNTHSSRQCPGHLYWVTTAGEGHSSYLGHQVKSTVENIFLKLCIVPDAGPHTVVAPSPDKSCVQLNVFLSLILFFHIDLVL